jgi:hypothetical protein
MGQQDCFCWSDCNKTHPGSTLWTLFNAYHMQGWSPEDNQTAYEVACLASLLDCVAPGTTELLCQLVSSTALGTMVDALARMCGNWRRTEALKKVG